MSNGKTNGAPAGASQAQPPPLQRDGAGQVAPAALADLIEWFLDHDPRVNVVRQPKVEELFQWKQAASRAAGEDVYPFANAEERLAVGIAQAVAQHAQERTLHAWLSQLLNALDDASKTNEEVAHAYALDVQPASVVSAAGKIPTARERAVYLTCCWLETLCTAEVRVLGWVYQELYGRAFHPDNFK